MNEKETLPEQDRVESSGRRIPDVAGLVVAWSSDEPWRIGQVLLVPPSPPGSAVVFGRGAEGPSRGMLVEQRPSGSTAVPPLASAAVSRSQLEIRSDGPDRVFMRNIGRCQLLHNSQPTSEAECQVGDTVQLGRQLLLLVVRRPTHFWGSDPAYPSFEFGVADPFGLVGESPAAWRLRGEVALIARRPGHVLVSGPSGVGKELVARAIHALSDRKARRLVARNAATLPESLIDAELFGNAKNYPNPGMVDRPGLVGLADESTLFLDEMAELPWQSQAHLLRVLDDGEYHRLGEGSCRRSNFRLLCATNRDPTTLKHDFLARLQLRVDVPELAGRREDIPLLVRHILRRAARAGDDIALSRFPGGDLAAEPALKLDVARELVQMQHDLNVRQLETTLWRLLATPTVTTTSSSAHDDRPTVPPAAADAPRGPVSRDAADGPVPASPGALSSERIQACLDEHNGVLELAWRALGMKNRFALLRAIKKHGLVIRRQPGRGRLRRSTGDT